ncbi:hypothetical protein A2U01_0008904 [Trifolium medium]|uniref:Uncharacterized protein n=1 Tax=Trifolium medium TaxID=97028 RepID=A0A392MLF7_9FABA|nr:hypothetical protein [Trifolium medium]
MGAEKRKMCFGSALLQNIKQEGSTDFMIFAEAHTSTWASGRLIITTIEVFKLNMNKDPIGLLYVKLDE